jgi:hypothetical protein
VRDKAEEAERSSACSAGWRSARRDNRGRPERREGLVRLEKRKPAVVSRDLRGIRGSFMGTCDTFKGFVR